MSEQNNTNTTPEATTAPVNPQQPAPVPAPAQFVQYPPNTLQVNNQTVTPPSPQPQAATTQPVAGNPQPQAATTQPVAGNPPVAGQPVAAPYPYPVQYVQYPPQVNAQGAPVPPVQYVQYPQPQVAPGVAPVYYIPQQPVPPVQQQTTQNQNPPSYEQSVSQTKITVNSNPVPAEKRFPRCRAKTTCPHCHKEIITNISYQNNALVWILALILLLTLVLFFWIPFVINDLKDVVHYCPECKAVVATVPRANN